VSDLTDPDRAALVALARQTIVSRLAHTASPAIDSRPAFAKRAGAFVTVTVAGELRGCIGITEPAQALGAVVQHCAEAAAFEDPRFPAIRPGDLTHLAVEVSVLSDLERVRHPADIVIGRDGLVIELGKARGLLLPQVAVEHGWGTEDFLRHTCLKAGLPPNAWQEGAMIWRFGAEVFGDKQLTIDE
jgi:AmmeMemoRadiSam system protein A